MFRRLKSLLLAVRAFNVRVREGFSDFFHTEVSGSLALLSATIVALLLANSALSEGYAEFWHTYFSIEFGDWALKQSLLHWIDDGLMAFFFLVVGLEIKRELIAGELSNPRKAALPIMAAIGGMAGPALLYALINMGGEGARGWGVPMATDIAFALGVLALLGPRIPASLRVFMAALAIADDIGAVLVIAIFYTSSIAWGWIAAAAVCLLILGVFNLLRVDSPLPYFLLGTIVWFCFLNSGVHATVAGVLVALTVPSRSRMRPLEFVSWARRKIDEIELLEVPGAHVLQTSDQQSCAQAIQAEARWIQAPLQRLEHSLLPISTFIILPLFALANAGVVLLGHNLLDLLTERVSLGIIMGLLVGKQVGITGLSWIAVRLGISELPEGVTWRHIWGVSWVAGIGFTMSLFISGLAFRAGIQQTEAKVAILVASLVAGVVGYLILRSAPEVPAEAGECELSEAA
jgi:NhaA family Na+:H+ antiporter